MLHSKSCSFVPATALAVFSANTSFENLVRVVSSPTALARIRVPRFRNMSTRLKPLVLILCTGNSCRSQMAEGILRASVGEIIRIESAGSAPTGQVHPLAIKVMNEIGIDISEHRSKPLSEFLDTPVHTVISVCGSADQACPMFPGMVRRYHWAFDDPAKLKGSENDVLAVFRKVRDEIVRVFGAYAAGLQMGKDHV